MGGGGKMFDVGHLIFSWGGGVNKNLSAAFCIQSAGIVSVRDV